MDSSQKGEESIGLRLRSRDRQANKHANQSIKPFKEKEIQNNSKSCAATLKSNRASEQGRSTLLPAKMLSEQVELKDSKGQNSFSETQSEFLKDSE